MANFDVAKAIFSLVDANKDGSIDPQEFRQWAAAGGAANASSSSSSYEASAGGIAADSEIGASASQAVYGSQGEIQSSGTLVVGEVGNAYESSSAIAGNEILQTSETAFESGSTQQSVQYSSTNGIFNDPNPQILRRAATGGAVTYEQKILVKFLQPPPVPPPGPLIIKEVRPPQPPPPPPLVIRQRAPALPQPPPLILRERPPVPPASVASQTVIRRLSAVPVPPRSVIIERLPPLPPKPRDIIIERWLPYAAQAKRQTIVQRAAAAKEYPPPRNLIIVYDAVPVRVVRQFQRFGVTQENPQAYVERHGTTLLDSNSLVQQARAAGVVEDISPPAGSSGQFSASSSGIETGFAYTSSSAEGISSSNGLQVLADGGGEFQSQSYSSASFGTEGGLATGGGFDIAAASFAAADSNRDGTLDKEEFERFIQGGISK